MAKTKKLVVPYEDAVALLKEAGIKTKFTREKVQSYFDSLNKKVEEDAVEDEDLKELYLDVCDALKKGNPVEVEEPNEVKPGPEPEPVKAKKAREDKPKKEKKEEKPRQKRPGICKTAMELLEKASESKPLSRDKLYELLVKRFPEHQNPESMKSTAYRAPYWIPYYFEVELHKSPKGYWLTRSYEGDYKRVKVQTKKEKA